MKCEKKGEKNDFVIPSATRFTVGWVSCFLGNIASSEMLGGICLILHADLRFGITLEIVMLGFQAVALNSMRFRWNDILLRCRPCQFISRVKWHSRLLKLSIPEMVHLYVFIVYSYLHSFLTRVTLFIISLITSKCKVSFPQYTRKPFVLKACDWTRKDTSLSSVYTQILYSPPKSKCTK